MYSYCGNNPINRIDPDGHAWKDIKNWISNTWSKAKKGVKTIKNKILQKHYVERKKKNRKHPTYKQVSSNPAWTKVSANQSKYHDNGVGKPELKYTHEDGREAVFDEDTLLEMKDARYIATYNYCPIQQLPDNPNINDYCTYAITMTGHTIQDVIPYYIWGNNYEDTSTIGERLAKSF